MQDPVTVSLEWSAAGQCVGHRAGFTTITAITRLAMLTATALWPMTGIGGKIAGLAHGILGCG